MAEPDGGGGRTWFATDVVAAFAGVLVICVADLVGIVRRPPGVPMDAGLVIFSAAGLALGGLLATPIVVARGALRRAAERLGARGLALTGVIDVGLLYLLAVHLQNPRDLQGETRGLALALLLSGGGAVAVWCTTARRAQPLALVGIAAACLLEHKLRWLSEEWMRLALNLAWIVGGTVLVRPLLAGRVGLRLALALTAAAVVVAIAVGPLVRGSSSARRALWGRSSQVYGWLALVSSALDRDQDDSVGWWGGRDCDPTRASVHPGAAERAGNGRDDNCAGGDAPREERLQPARAPARPRAPDARLPDILILTIDSLRWDIVDALPALSRAVGPHARFTRAVSPAAKTANTLAAFLRGIPFRALRLDDVPGVRGQVVWRDRSPTVGHVLTAVGYRAVTVPTDGYLDPRYGLAAGFEHVYASAYDARGLGLAWHPFARDRMRTRPALEVLLRLARTTRSPLAVWLHAMEPHFPFYWGERGKGPWSVAGLRRSVGDLDGPLARFVQSFVRVRGRRPVVAVTGDHGEEIWEHGSSAHGSSVHAEQVRVGFLLAGEGVPAGRFDAPVSISSLGPTLVDLVGAPVPTTMTEPSLVLPLEGRAPWPTVAVSESSVSGRSWIGYTGARHRLLLEAEHDLVELYDADRDPLEQRDLADARPDLVRSARREARRWDETH